MTTKQIETRANIIKPRKEKLLNDWCNNKDSIRRIRVNELIKRLEKELYDLESAYRVAKHKEFKEEKQWQEAVKNLCNIETCRLN